MPSVSRLLTLSSISAEPMKASTRMEYTVKSLFLQGVQVVLRKAEDRPRDTWAGLEIGGRGVVYAALAYSWSTSLDA